MRLLHTSDWHLGKRFFGRSLLSDQAYVLDQMINLVRDLKPNVTLVCGDVFHQRRPNEEVLTLFHETVSRILDLGSDIVFLAGPTDDFSHLHLDAQWVRNRGLYLFQDATQVLSPLSLRGGVRGRPDSFDVKFWCLPYPRPEQLARPEDSPAQLGRGLVERVVQRYDSSSVNVFVGYSWGQGAGKREEFGSLISSGGLPLEQRLLGFFDYSALGACHSPLNLGGPTIRYSGGLLADNPDDPEKERTVTFVDIEAKGSVSVDHYPLQPRRAFRVLSGSWEELIEQGRSQRLDDLLILRSQETELTSEQRAELRIVSPNVVSVEIESQPNSESEGQLAVSSLVRLFSEFAREVGQVEVTEEWLEQLRQIEGSS